MKLLISRTCFIQLIYLNCLLLKITTGLPVENEEKPVTDICPRIIHRHGWGARAATNKHENLKITPTPYVVIHHGGILPYCYDKKQCSEVVRSYQDLHMFTNKWNDIGYNFVIGEDGNVYEGRGWDFRGAHAIGYNTQSIGITIIGDFSHFKPNVGALKALDSLIACGVALKKISEDYAIIGHRQGRTKNFTVCPGEVFYNYVMAMQRWTSKPVPIYDSPKPNVTIMNNELQNDMDNNKIIAVL